MMSRFVAYVGIVLYDISMLPVLLRFGPFTIYSMGFLTFWGVLLGSFVFYKKAREAHFEAESIFDMLFYALFWSLVGARAFYIATHFSAFGFSLLKWLWLTNYVGLSFWGGLFFGMGAVIYKARAFDKDLFEWLDYLSLGLSLGIGFGMLGAFLNGSFLGPQTSLFFGLPFPGWESPLVPIQLFGAVAFFLFFFWWWGMEKRYRMLSWYRAGRVTVKTGFLWFGFLIFLGLTMAVLRFGFNLDAFLGLGIMVVGIVGIYARSGRRLKDEWRRLTSRRKRRF